VNIAELEAGAVQYRSATIEDVDTSGHELLVKAVPYDRPTDIGGGIVEEFKRGAFAKAAGAPHRLTVFHDHGGPLVGRGIEMEDRADGPYIRARIGKTPAALEMLSLIEDEILTDPSIEFRALKDHMAVERIGEKYRVTHRRSHLIGFAMTPEGAYGEQALVLSARDARRERQVEAAVAWLEEYKQRWE